MRGMKEVFSFGVLNVNHGWQSDLQFLLSTGAERVPPRGARAPAHPHLRSIRSRLARDLFEL